MSAKVPTVLFGSVDLESSRLLRERLRRDNVRILASGNTAEFLELARRSGPDVIVLEDTLESLGGEMLIRLLRQPCPWLFRIRAVCLRPGRRSSSAWTTTASS